MYRTAVFPGSFDPFTVGHESLVKKGLNIFDKIIVAVGINISKKGFMPVEKRIELIRTVFKNSPEVEVKTYENLTVDFCRENGATHILRGVRNSADFEYEHSIAGINRLLEPGIETVFLFPEPEYENISSSVVREIIHYKHDARKFLPEGIDFEYFFNS